MRMRFLSVLLLSCSGVALAAQTLSVVPVGEIATRLAQNNAQRDAALKNYESHREMTVAFKTRMGDGQAAEAVVMTYTAPATKQFTVVSATGPAFVRESVFQKEISSEQAAADPAAKQQAALTLANYDMRLVGQERLDVGECYVLDVTPKTTSPFAYRGRVWVQSTDYAVAKIEGQPAQDPSVWVSAGRFTTVFQKIGSFYFPRETTSTSKIMLGGDASLTIRYGEYRILQADRVRATTAR